jgi:hypothetical protein
MGCHVLFLLNDQVFQISGGLELANKARMPMEMVRGFRLADVVVAMQSAFVENNDLPRTDPVKAAALCWLLASRSQANAALFLPAAKCRKPSDVSYRLAQVPITVLGSLNAMQQQGRLSASVVNSSVWQAQAA